MLVAKSDCWLFFFFFFLGKQRIGAGDGFVSTHQRRRTGTDRLIGNTGGGEGKDRRGEER